MQTLLGHSRKQYLGLKKKVVALPPVYGIANIRSGYCSKQRLLENINSVYTVQSKACVLWIPLFFPLSRLFSVFVSCLKMSYTEFVGVTS